jgi:general L-amino acid transport system permease protein
VSTPLTTGLPGQPLEPVPPLAPPEPAPPASPDVRTWLRRNLFRSRGDAVVTVVSGLVVGYVLYRLLRFVFVTGRWDIVRTNLTLYMVGRYPPDEQWRIAVALWVIAAFGGVVAGHVARRRVAKGLAPPAVSLSRRAGALAGRLWPLIAGVLLILSLTTTVSPWLVALGVVAAAAVGRVVGGLLPVRRTAPTLTLVGIALGIAGVAFLTGPIGWDDWGGLMLNLFLAVAGISLCFPLGVLLALGRRTKLPILRALSVAYIELFRGVPLYVLLLLSAIALGFFMPSEADPPGLVVRAIVVFTLFTAAYVAEIVRGGLQSVPTGQTEAAQALGLSPVRTTALVVLPQALRNVIPALVGQFISLFKDTTLAGAAMGFFEVYTVSQAVTAQPEFRGQGLFSESTAFLMLLFWIGCITMSRESQRLERKLGVGTR